ETGGAQTIGRLPSTVLAAEPNAATVRPQRASDDAEQGGLAGAVRTDHADHPASIDAHGYIAQRVHAAEMLVYVFDLEQRRHVTICPWTISRRCRRACAAP